MIAASSEAKAFEALLWFGVILVVVVAAGVVLLFVRRRLNRSDRGTSTAFTLDELRQMRDRGDVSAEEFEALKRRIMSMGR